MSNFKDVTMSWVEDDIEKVQQKPNLYLRKYGSTGCNHLSAEIIQNAYDECIDKNSPGNKVEIIYDKKFDRLTVSDNGRGFPETDYSIDIFCTKIQSGSKSKRSQSGGTSGEFGVGATVVNALSTEFKIVNKRRIEKTIHGIVFEEGKKIDDYTIANTKKEHGSTVSFIPNKKYLGYDASIDIDALLDWVKKLTYLFGPQSKKITTIMEVYDGDKKISKDKQEPQEFSDLLSVLEPSLTLPQINVAGSSMVQEVDMDGTVVNKDLLLEVSFGYAKETNPNEITKIDSYCNFTNTIDGGVHESTVDECICRYLQMETKLSLSDKEREKIDILWSDVRTDLRITVNLLSSAQVQFVGNAKTQIGNKELVNPIKIIMSTELKKFFSENRGLLDSYIKIVKKNAKARIELSKIKNTTIRTKHNSMLDFMDKNFSPCNNKGKAYKEIYLVEGDSAAGCVVTARDADCQAVLAFRGVTVNAYKRDENTIYNNLEMKNYCEKIGFDIRTQDLSRVRYNKIIIATDADVDGESICAALYGFHAKFGRAIVDAGLLYRVMPPLYRLDDKKHQYSRSKKENIDIYVNKIASLFKLTINENDKLSNSELKEFIYDTGNYLHDIVGIANHFSVHSKLMEIIIYHICMYSLVHKYEHLGMDTIEDAFTNKSFIKIMMSDIQSLYPEMILQGHSFTGVVDGAHLTYTVTRTLLTYIHNYGLRDIFKKYGLFINYEEKKCDAKQGTILDFLVYALKYEPTILHRFKGLGECDWEDLEDTIMNPTKRLLIRLSFNDIERDLKKIELLQATGVEAMRYRKKLMKTCKIDKDDIDN